MVDPLQGHGHLNPGHLNPGQLLAGHLPYCHPQDPAGPIQLAHQVGLVLMAFAGQGNPHHPASPHPGQGPIQQGIASRDHYHPIWTQAGGDLALGRGNRLAAA